MKKIFIEPEMIRIDLKMTENIAASSLEENKFSLQGEGDSRFDFFATLQYGPIGGTPCRELLAYTGVPYYPEMKYEDALKVLNTPNGYLCFGGY